MSEQPRQVMVEVTDQFGNVEAEPLYVIRQGAMIRLEIQGLVLNGLTDEFSEAGVIFVDVEPGERAA